MSLTVTETFQKLEEWRKFKENDIFDFFSLHTSLHDQRRIPLQKKINTYIQEHTESTLCFFVYQQYTVQELLVDVVGKKELKPELIIRDTCQLFWIIATIRTPRPILKISEIEPNLRQIINYALLDTCSKYENCVLIPVFHPKFGSVVFHIALVNYKEGAKYFEKTQRLIGEIMRYSTPLLYNTFIYEEERLHHEKSKNALCASFKILDETGDLDELLAMIKKQLCTFFGAQRCYLLILQNNILVSRININDVFHEFGYERLKDVTVPLGSGVQGKAAINKKFYNYNDYEVETVNVLHKAAEMMPENVLCFPMYYRGEVFGVIELHNKETGVMFTKVDEAYTLPFGIICGTALGKCIVLKGFESTRDTQFKGDLLLLRSVLLKKCSIGETLICQQRHNLQFNHYKFIPQQIPENHVICYCVKMLNNTGLVEKYKVPELTLLWFLNIVRNSYSDLPFHNWYHIFAVFHFIYLLIYQYGIVEDELVTPLEAFAMLVAALCHDMEFRGTTSRFQTNRGAVLASLYCSPGNVDKSFAASQAIRIFSLTDANILEEMSPTDYKNFINLLYTMITCTDLWLHITNMNEMKRLIASNEYDQKEEEHRVYLYSVIMAAADLCSYAKSWSYSKFISECQYKELYRFRDLYYAVNIFNLKQVAPTPSKMPSLQVQIIVNYCLPTFEHLKNVAPATEVFYNRLQSNLKRWEQLKSNVDEKKKEEEILTMEEESEEDMLRETISERLIPKIFLNPTRH